MVELLLKMMFQDIFLELIEEIPDYSKAQEIYNEAVSNSCWLIGHVPDNFKTQKMCDKAIKDDPSFLQFIPDWFVTTEGTDMWCDDYYDGKDKFIEFTDDEDNFIEWYDGYKKRKAQKASIKEELLPIAWHPSRYWDWCMPEDKKKETEKLWA